MSDSDNNKLVNISFYYPFSDYHKSLAKLILKILSKNDNKILLVAEDYRELVNLDNLLWSNNDKFIPHATFKDLYPEEQPVLITTNSDRENKNQANIIISYCYLEKDFVNQFEHFIYFINSSSEDLVNKAREDWKLYKNAGYNIKYWKQDGNFVWNAQE